MAISRAEHVCFGGSLFSTREICQAVGICLCSLSTSFPSGWGLPAWDRDPHPQNRFAGDTVTGRDRQ